MDYRLLGKNNMVKKIGACLLTFFTLVRQHEATLTTNQLRVYQKYNSVYYDPVTNLTLKSEIEDSGRLPDTRIGFRSLPCACEELSCGCCAGINITRIKFDQKACTNFTYDPYEFAIKMEVAMNEHKIFTNKISAKNPPPICVPFAYIPAIVFCVRFYNIFMPGKNLHVCMDFETKVIQTPVLVLHFDCVRVGADGVAWVKPDENGGLDKPDIEDSSSPNSEPEIYDEVNFESANSQQAVVNDSNSSLSLQDEQNIGQLKNQ